MARVIKASGPQAAGAGGAAGVMSLTEIAAEAREVVLDARKQAGRILAEAKVRAERARQAAAERGYEEGLVRGRSDGYEEGYRLGRREGAAAFSREAAGLTDLLKRLAGELSAAREQLLQEGGRELLEFALEVAGRIVGRVAGEGTAAAEANLRKALELADGSRAVRVRSNPADVEALRRCAGALAEELSRSAGIEFVADGAISRGGVKLTCGAGEIDATIETQWANVVEALLGARPAVLPGAGGAPAEDAGKVDPAQAAGSAGPGRYVPTGEARGPGGGVTEYPPQVLPRLSAGSRRGAAPGEEETADFGPREKA